MSRTHIEDKIGIWQPRNVIIIQVICITWFFFATMNHSTLFKVAITPMLMQYIDIFFLAYLLSNMYLKNRDSSYPCSQPQSQSTPQPIPGSPSMFVEWIKNNLPAITPTQMPRYKCDFRINWTRELYSLSDPFNIFCRTLLSDSITSTSISSLLTIHLNEQPSILEVVVIISGCSDNRG